MTNVCLGHLLSGWVLKTSLGRQDPQQTRTIPTAEAGLTAGLTPTAWSRLVLKNVFEM